MNTEDNSPNDIPATESFAQPTQPLESGEFKTKLNGLELWYKVYGGGPVCIFPTTGWGWSAELYIATLTPLEELFTMVHLETRGTGHSERPLTTQEYSWDQFVTDLEALRAHLGQERVWLMGHSHGGLMVIQYALAHPERVTGLLLIDTLPNYDEHYLADVAARAKQRETRPWAQETLRRYLFDPPRTQEELDKMAGGDENYWYDLANAEKAAPLFAATSTSLHAYQGVADSRQAAVRLIPLLPRIKAPTLIVVGIASVMASPTQAQRLHLGLANSKLFVVEKAGHFPWLEEPDAFFSGIRTYLPVLGYTPQ